MKLGNIATVRSGLVLSRKQARESMGVRYPLLNLRSVNPRGYIEMNLLDVFDASEKLSSEYLSQTGDVIIRLSAPYTAILIDDETVGMVVSSNFIIIRTKRDELLPGYLVWLLNTPEVKHLIYENTSSNMLGAIKARFFSEFEVSLLPIARQQQIAVLNELAMKEAKLLRQLAYEKECYYSLLIDSIHKELKRGN